MKDPQLIPSGYIDFFNEVDPAVVRAQRMAELEQMAKYRAEKLAYYALWSADKDKAIEKLEGKRIEVGEEIVKSMPLADKLYPEFKWAPTKERIAVSEEYQKPEPEKPLKWYQKLWKKFVE